jgi:hypothetical protein
MHGTSCRCGARGVRPLRRLVHFFTEAPTRSARPVLIALLAFVAGEAGAIVVGPDIPIPVTTVPCPYYLCGPWGVTTFEGAAVGSDGIDFLVVWSESAYHANPGPEGEPGVDVPRATWAIRIDPSGTILDPSPIFLTGEGMAGPYWNYLGIAHAVASDLYLVVGSCSFGPCATRVTSGGVVLDAVPFALPPGDLGGFGTNAPRVTSNGTDFFVFYGGMLVRVGASGALLDPSPIAIPGTAVAFDGTNFLAVWADRSAPYPASATVWATRIDTLGNVLDPPQLLASRPHEIEVEVAFDGTSFVVLTLDPYWEGIRALLVSPSGTLIPGSDTLLLTDAGTPSISLVVASGANCGVVVWVYCYVCEPGRPSGLTFSTSMTEVLPAVTFEPGGSVGWLSLELVSNSLGQTLYLYDGAAYGDWGGYLYYPKARIFTVWAPLSISKTGAGVGTVTSTPAGIDCGPTCMAAFGAPEVVTLVATPSAESRFAGWSGDCAGTEPTCTTTIDAARAVVAAFAPLDATSPVVTVPADLTATASTKEGALVSFTASATDDVDGALTPTCVPASGSLFAPGSTVVQCSATDAAGNAGTASFSVSVLFDWSGFVSPLRADSAFRLKRTIPVKFTLLGESAAIEDLVATLEVVKVAEGVAGTAQEVAAAAAADRGSAFRYDPVEGQYVFNLATGAMSPGTWALTIDMGDGLPRTLQLSLLP